MREMGHGLPTVPGFCFHSAGVAVVLNFVIPRLMPGDPASTMFARFQGRLAPEAMVSLRAFASEEAIRVSLAHDGTRPHRNTPSRRSPAFGFTVLAVSAAIGAVVGTTVGGSIGVKSAVVSWDHTLKVTQDIINAATQVRKDIFFLAHGGPINTPEDADRVIRGTSAVGFVGASSLERMGVEESLTGLTRKFKSLTLPRR